jgi:hypothetical protein
MSDIDMIVILDHFCTTCDCFCKLLIESFSKLFAYGLRYKNEILRAFLRFKDSPFLNPFPLAIYRTPPEEVLPFGIK